MINEYRQNLIKLVLEFILSCKNIESIQRIANIGSLISNKIKPKDVDLLLNISEDMDLTHLAKISRTLQGKSGGLIGGADVNAHDKEKIGETPLGLVAANCSYKMAELFIAAGADPTIPGWMKITALDRAAKRKKEEGKKVYSLLLGVSRKKI